MAELAAGALADVALDLLPVVLIVAHFFAVRADGEHLFELADLAGEAEHALGDAQAHPELLHVEGLVEEVVHAGVAGGLLVVHRVLVGREQNEIGVLHADAAADFLAQFEAVHAGHVPVADDEAYAVGGEFGPGFLAIGCLNRLVAEAVECLDQDGAGKGIVFDGEDAHGGAEVAATRSERPAGVEDKGAESGGGLGARAVAEGFVEALPSGAKLGEKRFGLVPGGIAGGVFESEAGVLQLSCAEAGAAAGEGMGTAREVWVALMEQFGKLFDPSWHLRPEDSGEFVEEGDVGCASHALELGHLVGIEYDA